MSTPNNINDEEKLQFNKSQSQLLHQPNLSGANEQDQLQKTDNHYIYSTGAKIGQGFLIGLGVILFLGDLVLMAPLIPTVGPVITGAVPFLGTASAALGTLGTVVISIVGNLVGIGMVTVGGILVDLSRKAENEEQEKIKKEQNKIEGKQEGKNENDNNKDNINEQNNKRINNKEGIDKNIINNDNNKEKEKNIENDNSNEKENNKNYKKEKKKKEKQEEKIEQQTLNNNDIDQKKNKNTNKEEPNMQEKYNKHKLNQLGTINMSKFQSEAPAFVKNTKLAYKGDTTSKKTSETILKKNIDQNYHEAIKSYQFYENIMNSKSSGVISHKISNISINKHQNREESEYVRELLKADENNSERNDEDKHDNEFQNKPNDLHYVEGRESIEQMIKDNQVNKNEAENEKKINKEQNNKDINNEENIGKNIINNDKKEENDKNDKQEEKQEENHDSKEGNDSINNSEKEKKEEKGEESNNKEEEAKKTEDNKKNAAETKNNNGININKENQENENNSKTNDRENAISGNNKNDKNSNEKKEGQKHVQLLMGNSSISKVEENPKKPSLYLKKEQINKEKNEEIKKEEIKERDNKYEKKEEKIDKIDKSKEKKQDGEEKPNFMVENFLGDDIFANKTQNSEKENANEETEQDLEKKKENDQILSATGNYKNNQVVVNFINTELLDIAQNIDIGKTMEEIGAYKNKRKGDYCAWFFRHSSDNPTNNVDLNEQKKDNDNKDNEENDNLIDGNENSSVQYSNWFDRHSEKSPNSAEKGQKNDTESNTKTVENVNNNNDVEGKNKEISSKERIKDNINKKENVRDDKCERKEEKIQESKEEKQEGEEKLEDIVRKFLDNDIFERKMQNQKETKESDRINEINNHTNNQLVNPVGIEEKKLGNENTKNNMGTNDNKKKTDGNSNNMTDQGKNTDENKEKGETKQNKLKQFFTSVFKTTEKTKRKNCDNESNTETEKANTADTKKIKNEGIKHGKIKQFWTKAKNGIVDWVKRKPDVQKHNLSISHGGNNLKKTLLSKFRWSKNQNQNQSPILNEDTCKDK